jgi:acyl-CoA thioester hydrolase
MRPIPYVQPDMQSWLAKFRFSIPIKVRYSETDMTGHVNNVSYFIYFEQARFDYIDYLGISDRLFNEETVMVVADLECTYLAQIFIREPLRLYVRSAKIGRSSLDMEYAFVQEETGELKAVGRGAVVYMSPKDGKSVPLPEDLKDKIQAFEQQEEIAG